MNLKEILAQKTQKARDLGTQYAVKEEVLGRRPVAARPPLEEKEETLQTEETETEDLDIPYLSSVDIKYLSNSSISPLFASVYSSLVKNPYQNISTFNTFSSFILDNNIHILNTFPHCNIDKIYSLIMQHNPPRDINTDLPALCSTLHTIYLNVPQIYESILCAVIEDKK